MKVSKYIIWGPLEKSRAVPVTGKGGGYADALRAFAGVAASGVYKLVDRDSGEVLYVGESHTGRIYDTITRHFRAWERKDRGGQRRGGVSYDRRRIAFAVELTTDADAQPRQYALIQLLRPRDNSVDGLSVAEPDISDLPI
jgi:hypothetical protein